MLTAWYKCLNIGLAGALGRQSSVAVWFPGDQVALVLAAKGHLTRTLGFTWQGHMWLLPEEVMFEVERGTLLLWLAPTSSWWGPDFDAKNTTRVTEEHDMLTLPACYQLLLGSNPSKGLELAVYHTYAYLRRLGYTAVRSPIYHHHQRAKARREGTLVVHSSKPATATVSTPWLGAHAAAQLLRWMRMAAGATCTWLFGWFARWWTGPSWSRTSSTLIRPVALKDWAPESLPHVLDAPQSLADFSQTADWHYCVYRPSTAFSKRKIAEADCRVFVQNRFRDALSLSYLHQLAATTGFAANLALAIVDQSNVAFLTLNNAAIDILGNGDPSCHPL